MRDLAVGALALVWVLHSAPTSAGLVFQILCQPGSASPDGFAPCTVCAPGTFAAGLGARQCQVCPSGTYADAPGSVACVRDEVLWPSAAASCGDTDDLDGCIEDGIRDGGVVRIAEDAVPAQTVSIAGKSFTLRREGDHVPVFAGGSMIEFNGGDTDVAVVIEGLTLARGTIRANQRGLGRFQATIRDNSILAATIGAIQLSNINIGAPAIGPSEFLIERNAIAVDRENSIAIAVSLERADAENGAVIRGNVIDQVGSGDAAAIRISSRESSLIVDLIGNVVDGTDFNAGVEITQHVDGHTVATVANNAISGQVVAAGNAAGIAVTSLGGVMTLNAVNNSLAFNDIGLRLSRVGLGGLFGAIANNVVAFNGFGLFIPEELEADVVNESNLVFGNEDDVFTPGPGTLVTDPLFVLAQEHDASDPPEPLSLLTNSPARDAGNDARVPESVTVDRMGAARISGAHVDIGAYELAPEPANLLGVAAAVACLAWRTRRRRPGVAD